MTLLNFCKGLGYVAGGFGLMGMSNGLQDAGKGLIGLSSRSFVKSDDYAHAKMKEISQIIKTNQELQTQFKENTEIAKTIDEFCKKRILNILKEMPGFHYKEK